MGVPLHGECENVALESNSDIGMHGEDNHVDDELTFDSQNVESTETSNKNEQSKLGFKECYVDISPLSKDKLMTIKRNNSPIEVVDSTKGTQPKDKIETTMSTDEYQQRSLRRSENDANRSNEVKLHPKGKQVDLQKEKKTEAPSQSNIAINSQKSQDNLLKRIDTLEKLVKQWKNICSTTKEEATNAETKWKAQENEYKKQLLDIKNELLPENAQKETEGEDLSKLLKKYLQEIEEKHLSSMRESESKMRETLCKMDANLKEKEDKRLREANIQDQQFKEMKEK